MKRNFLLILLLIFFSSTKFNFAQNTLLGMTTEGGIDGLGVIFETDANGNNCIAHSFTSPFPGRNPIHNNLCEASNGKLYGMTSNGGTLDLGVIFEYDPVNDIYVKKFQFEGANGYTPLGTLVKANNDKLYGMAFGGGLYSAGVIFQYDPYSNLYSIKYNFNNGINGGFPNGSLNMASNGKLYGLTWKGGTSNYGVLFEFDPTNNSFVKHVDFIGTNGAPLGNNMIEASNGKLYGMTYSGGSSMNTGVIFEFDPSNNLYTVKMDLDSVNGFRPWSNSLMQASNGKLYGMTSDGGTYGHQGTLFEYDILTNTYTKKVDFDSNNTGGRPYGDLVEVSNGKLYGMCSQAGLSNPNGVIFEFIPSTSSFSVIHIFNGTEGGFPQGSLMKTSTGRLFGMAQGLIGGVLFEYDSLNGVDKKFDFNSAPNGANPYGSLLQASNGKLYGMTNAGGINNTGVIFEYDKTTDSIISKFDFSFSNGYNPKGNLIEASNGKFYGLTQMGGANDAGVLFEFDPISNLYSVKIEFDHDLSGWEPYGSLVQASNGKLYGMTEMGGANTSGNIFEYDIVTNLLTNKYDFNSSSGEYPRGSLIQAANGLLYGMTEFAGGVINYGTLFSFNITTNVFSKKITFNDSTGGSPFGSLIELSNGKLYGLTSSGGLYYRGVLFEYDPSSNQYSKKIDFLQSSTGSEAYGSLLFATNGKMYGLNYAGGANDLGTFFEFDPITDSLVKKLDFDLLNGSRPYYSAMIEYNPTVGISSLPKSEAVKLYPNPANNLITISNIDQQILEINIFEIHGKNILSLDNMNTQEAQIDISKIQPGIYFLRIKTKNNSITKKFIKV